MDAVTKATRQALRGMPVSLRFLARSAGISHAHLARIAAGLRPATPAIARDIAIALEGISRRCRNAAQRIRSQTLDSEGIR
jgi:hypothetical protein